MNVQPEIIRDLHQRKITDSWCIFRSNHIYFVEVTLTCVCLALCKLRVTRIDHTLYSLQGTFNSWNVVLQSPVDADVLHTESSRQPPGRRLHACGVAPASDGRIQ